MAQYFYDQTCRKFLLQFTRMFSNFFVGYGQNPEKPDTLVRVPVRYGDATRMAQSIMQNNSPNSMPSAPLMTFYITGLDYDRPRVQDPYFISNTSVRQREYDPITGTYGTTQGNAFTIERPMPVPYKMTIALDIWTSNTNQKFQIWEQIAPLFNPSLEIQASDNFIDWSTLTVVELKSTKWSSRSIPQGTEDPIDICTFEFEIPIWISSPIKVKKLGVVERVIASVYDANGDLDNALIDGDLLLGTRQCITPYNYQILVFGLNDPTVTGRIQCLPENIPPNPSPESLQPEQPIDGARLWWEGITAMYGGVRPGISYIALEQWDGSEVNCYIAPDPTDDRFLLITGTSNMPINSLLAIDSVVNPQSVGPGVGLPLAASGQRYLFTDDIGSDKPFPNHDQAWSGPGVPLDAKKNDIVEYDGTQWNVVFNAKTSTTAEYVTNIATETQYRWTGTEWVRSVDQLYAGGEWRFVI